MTPVIFFGHGNPMNAIEDNAYSRAWRALGERLPRPHAILAISAHWYVPETVVTLGAHPRTIHDFGGFPPALYEMEYPAPGDDALSDRVSSLLRAFGTRGDVSWGLDHGTWAVLCHVFPDASIPIVQLSIDERQPGAVHYEIGTKLRELRDEGVMIVASGNIVHNLHTFAWGRHPVKAFPWAERFEAQVRSMIENREHLPLVDYESMGEDALLSVPTPDHYLPLLYALGASDERDEVSFPVEGIDGGSVSMLSVLWSRTTAP